MNTKPLNVILMHIDVGTQTRVALLISEAESEGRSITAKPGQSRQVEKKYW